MLYACCDGSHTPGCIVLPLFVQMLQAVSFAT